MGASFYYYRLYLLIGALWNIKTYISRKNHHLHVSKLLCIFFIFLFFKILFSFYIIIFLSFFKFLVHILIVRRIFVYICRIFHSKYFVHIYFSSFCISCCILMYYFVLFSILSTTFVIIFLCCVYFVLCYFVIYLIVTVLFSFQSC